MDFSPLVAELIQQLQWLPGIGPRSAQRMAMHLLEADPAKAKTLIDTVDKALSSIIKCESCQVYTEISPCQICQSTVRNQSQLCIVENPADMIAIEASMSYSGRYFILYGKLSPIDGIGPSELKLDQLATRLEKGVGIEEIILATNPTIEGEATAYYVSKLAKKFNKKVTRIAYGVPFGGELEYTDAHTLSRALESRS